MRAAREKNLAAKPRFVLGWILAAAAGALPARGDAPGPDPSALTAPQRTSLAALDRTIARCEALLARDDDRRHQAATRPVLDGLEKRRAALAEAFDPSKYDDLRSELNLAYQRLAAWMAPPVTRPDAGPRSP
jgi:hypothetical protein